MQSKDDCQQVCNTLTFPIIAKTPTKISKQGLKKAYILSEQHELEKWYESIQAIQQEFVIQEYIPGTDHSVFFYNAIYISGR